MNRRKYLAAAAVTGLLVALAACGDSTDGDGGGGGDAGDGSSATGTPWFLGTT